TKKALAQETQRRQQLRRTLDAMSSPLIDGWLAKQPVLLPEHKRFLEQALALYEEFTQDTGQDEQARAGAARAYFRVGLIRFHLRQMAEARAAISHSQELLAQLAAEFPNVLSYRQDLASSHNNLAALLRDMERAKEAEEEHRAALALWKQLADDSPV